MKTLVEETYVLAGNASVTLVVHSMGGPMSLVFLQQMPTSWKDRYIARIISLAGAWAGSAKAVKVFAIGDDLGSFALSGSVMRAEQITSPSLAWLVDGWIYFSWTWVLWLLNENPRFSFRLMPSPHIWKPDDVLVTTPNKQYTMSNIEDFFQWVIFG